MSIWLFQAIGKEIRLIGYYENNGKGMEHYIQWLNQYASTNGVMLGQHLAPHDIEVRELTSGRSRKDVAREMGISFRTVQRPRTKAEGIQAIRRMFPRFWFDQDKAEHGLNCIASYHREFDEKRNVFRRTPDGMIRYSLARVWPCLDRTRNEGIFDVFPVYHLPLSGVVVQS